MVQAGKLPVVAHGDLEPWAEIIKAEFREKLGYPVTFNFRKLAAADIAARQELTGL